MNPYTSPCRFFALLFVCFLGLSLLACGAIERATPALPPPPSAAAQRPAPVLTSSTRAPSSSAQPSPTAPFTNIPPTASAQIPSPAPVKAIGLPEDAVPLSLVFDPRNSDVLYMGTLDHGLFWSRDGGMTWESLTDQLKAVLGIAVDPDNSQLLYAAANGAMMKSMDGGSKWVLQSTGMGRLDEGHFPRNISIYKGITETVVYTPGYSSVDAGGSWQRWSSWGFSAIAIDPGDPRLMYAVDHGGGNGGVHKSTNGGETWADFMNGLPKVWFTAIAVDPHTPSTLYVGASDPLGLYKSSDNGENWLPIHIGLRGGGVSAIAIDPSTPDRLFVATHGIEIHAYGGGVGISVGGQGGLFVSLDGGEHWSAQWP